MRRAELLLAALLATLLAASPAAADDWLQSALAASEAAALPSEPLRQKPTTQWAPFESSVCHSELPSTGWRSYEEEDALGTVVRVLGPDSSSGGVRTTLSVRLFDRSMPGFLPAKQAVDDMRRDAPGRSASPVRAMRVAAGLARIFEIEQTRRSRTDDGPSFAEPTHVYVAVVPRGESYYLVRMISAKDDFLDSRDVFVRFVKRMSAIGGR